MKTQVKNLGIIFDTNLRWCRHLTRMLPGWGVLGMCHQEEAQGRPRTRSQLAPVARQMEVWASLLRLPPCDQPQISKRRRINNLKCYHFKNNCCQEQLLWAQNNLDTKILFKTFWSGKGWACLWYKTKLLVWHQGHKNSASTGIRIIPRKSLLDCILFRFTAMIQC